MCNVKCCNACKHCKAYAERCQFIYESYWPFNYRYFQGFFFYSRLLLQDFEAFKILSCHFGNTLVCFLAHTEWEKGNDTTVLSVWFILKWSEDVAVWQINGMLGNQLTWFCSKFNSLANKIQPQWRGTCSFLVFQFPGFILTKSKPVVVCGHMWSISRDSAVLSRWKIWIVPTHNPTKKS